MKGEIRVKEKQKQHETLCMAEASEKYQKSNA
jgi:hypothetical protein